MTGEPQDGACAPQIQRALDEHTTLTLAYLDEAGFPQACAVFYAATDVPTLVFLTSADTAHGRALLAAGSGAPVAFTAQRDGQTWTDITGIQGRGTCHRLSGHAAAAARRAYAQRFPFIDTASSLSRALDSTDFWEIRPHWIRLVDNTRGFGHKTEWTPKTHN